MTAGAPPLSTPPGAKAPGPHLEVSKGPRPLVGSWGPRDFKAPWYVSV